METAHKLARKTVIGPFIGQSDGLFLSKWAVLGQSKLQCGLNFVNLSNIWLHETKITLTFG